MNPNRYPLIAIVVSQSICRLRLVRSEEEHLRFVLDFYPHASFFYTVDTPMAIYIRRLGTFC
jgi:hypothetical protein